MPAGRGIVYYLLELANLGRGIPSRVSKAPDIKESEYRKEKTCVTGAGTEALVEISGPPIWEELPDPRARGLWHRAPARRAAAEPDLPRTCRGGRGLVGLFSDLNAWVSPVKPRVVQAGCPFQAS